MKTLCLKIDICTHDGMRDGVPRLLDLLGGHGARGSFFLSFGPDYSGRAILNVLKPGFLRKMLRTSAPSMYGLRTMLSGTLLPARRIATRYPDVVRRIDAEGHEVAVHAWNHRRWQDGLERLGAAAIRQELARGLEAYEQILGKPARAWGSAAWFVTPESLALLDELDLLYASDLRGGPPCRLRSGKTVFRTLQIPTTGTCIEELLASGVGSEEQMAEALLRDLTQPDLAVMAVHAEVEGGPYLGFFDRLLGELAERRDAIRRLDEVAAALQEPPVRELDYATLPGRSGKVATSRR